jgi:putative peptidoglycan lipid II flippase
MVKRILRFFNQEISGLHEAAYLLGFFALLSQILALFRDRLLAFYFGPSNALDIYYAGFRIPDFIFVIFTSIVSISVLVPFLTEKLEKGKDAGKDFINTIFTFFFLLIILVSVFAFIFLPKLLPWLFPGLADYNSLGQLILVSRILLLSPILLGISNFLASITQVSRKFIIYSISPLLYNLGIIIGIIFFYPLWGVAGLAVGVVLGAFCHMFIQIPSVMYHGLFPKLTTQINFSNLREVVLISVPRSLTVASTQIATFALVSIASIMGVGAISIFNFSLNLQSVPLSIIGVSYSIAAFPALSKLFALGEKNKFFDEVIVSARHMIFWSLPVIVLFIVLRAQIVRTILGAGKFDWADTRLTAAALGIFVVSVLAQSLLLLLIRAYYAMGKTHKPFYANIGSAFLAIALSYLFVKIFDWSPMFRYFLESLWRVEDLSKTVLLTLPLGYSLAMIIGCWYLLSDFNKTFPRFYIGLKKTFFQSFCGAILAGFGAYIGLNIFDDIFNLNTFLGIFGQGFAAGILGIIIGVITLFALGSEELKEVWRTLHRKIWKAKPLTPEVSEL